MNQLSMMPDWNPRRNGKIYCSPACGGGCLWADFHKAQNAAKRLCYKLGEGWKPRVFENLGWYYEAVNATCSVRPFTRLGQGPYCADLRTGGHQFIARSHNPKAAVQAVIDEAIKSMNTIRDTINTISGGKPPLTSLATPPEKAGYYRVYDRRGLSGIAFMHRNRTWTLVDGIAESPYIKWELVE